MPDIIDSPKRHLFDVVMPYGGDECLPWPFSKNKKGYGQMHYAGRNRLVSSIVCELVHGPAPTPHHQAAHSCGNGRDACVTKRHLSWKTHKENEADKIIHGTIGRGHKNSQSKLAEGDVLTIRNLRGQLSQSEIGAVFGVTKACIGQIQRNRNWAWLSKENLT